MSDINDIMNKMRYVSLMRPIFRKRAVFSDETESYRDPVCPKPGEDVKIRLRTLKNNVDGVYFISGNMREPMKAAYARNGFDYYEVTIPVGEAPILYYFELRVEELVLYYNKMGITRDLTARNAFRITPGFSTPDWSHGAVMYQIYTDRFRNGNPSNDVLSGEYSYLNEHVNKVEDWNRPPENMDVRNFYGGDLQGILEKLDYLEDLGVEVLYLNPIFVSPSNHKYDIQDYDHVDPHFGVIVVPGEPGRLGRASGTALGGGPQERHAPHPGRRVQPLRILQQVAGPGAHLRKAARLREGRVHSQGQPLSFIFQIQQ